MKERELGGACDKCGKEKCILDIASKTEMKMGG
jgi:hypothetical protein